MDREQLIRECLVLTCFLENIDTHDKPRIIRLLSGLNSYTTEELKKYYDVNSSVKEVRIDRLLHY